MSEAASRNARAKLRERNVCYATDTVGRIAMYITQEIV